MSLRTAYGTLIGVLWDLSGLPGSCLLGSLGLSWASLRSRSQNSPEQTQSWGPSEISEIVTTPTGAPFSFLRGAVLSSFGALLGSLGSLFGLSWALLGLSWLVLGFSWAHICFLGALLGYTWCSRALLGSPEALFGLSWCFLGHSWVCLGLSQGFQASSAILASRFPKLPSIQASPTCLRSSVCVFVSIVVGSCLVDGRQRNFSFLEV